MTRDFGFVARLTIAAPLPCSRPDGVRFARTVGLQDFCLLASRQIGLPYGRLPRLALAWMTTEAMRRQTRRIPLPSSLSRFARQIGITPSTGPDGALSRLRDQTHRLVHLSIACLDPSALSAAFRSGEVRLVERALLWGDPPCGEPGPFILFSQDFYDEIIDRPIPIDLGVIRSLRSPLAIDLYTWLTYRSLRVCRSGRPETIAWEALLRQLGAGSMEASNLRPRRAVESIRRADPGLRLRSSPAGLELLPSPLEIRTG